MPRAIAHPIRSGDDARRRARRLRRRRARAVVGDARHALRRRARRPRRAARRDRGADAPAGVAHVRGARHRPRHRGARRRRARRRPRRGADAQAREARNLGGGGDLDRGRPRLPPARAARLRRAPCGSGPSTAATSCSSAGHDPSSSTRRPRSMRRSSAWSRRAGRSTPTTSPGGWGCRRARARLPRACRGALGPASSPCARYPRAMPVAADAAPGARSLVVPPPAPSTRAPLGYRDRALLGDRRGARGGGARRQRRLLLEWLWLMVCRHLAHLAAPRGRPSSRCSSSSSRCRRTSGAGSTGRSRVGRTVSASRAGARPARCCCRSASGRRRSARSRRRRRGTRRGRGRRACVAPQVESMMPRLTICCASPSSSHTSR